MKQFMTILKFELLEYFKNKVFIGITAFLVAILALMMFVPDLLSGIFSDSNDEKPVMIVSSDQNEVLVPVFTSAFPTYTIETMDNSDTNAIENRIRNKEAECAFVFEDNTISRYTYYVENLGMYDTNTETADAVLNEMVRAEAFEEKGISAADTQMIMSLSVSHDTTNLGQDQVSNFLYTYIMIMALYMVIAMYGQMVASHVAAEKDSRVMELLIATSDPTSMMFGKVLASCIAGLFQLAVIFGSALLFYNLNPDAWGDSPMLQLLFDIPLHLLGFMLVFFLLGYLIYAFLYGAIGSTVSRIEDLSTALTPLTFIFIAAFMIVVFGISSGDVDTPLMIAASWFPLSSPMAMFTRIGMSTVSTFEIAGSIIVLIISLFLIGKLSAKIYRTGVLLYGKKVNFFSLLKQIIKA